MTDPVFAQPGSGVRFGWGLAGAAELGRACAVLVVVDVLSFTTSVDVAVGRDVPAAVRGSASGRELAGRGYRQDVEIAAEVAVSDIVPLLRNGAFSAG